jgi:hypothetical protein
VNNVNHKFEFQQKDNIKQEQTKKLAKDNLTITQYLHIIETEVFQIELNKKIENWKKRKQNR